MLIDHRDFVITYKNKRNMWAHLGMGYSMKNLNNNFSPTFDVDFIDPKWLAAVGSPVDDPTRVTPIGAWRPHDPPKKKDVDEIAKAPMTEVAQKSDDFPGQSTLAD